MRFYAAFFQEAHNFQSARALIKAIIRAFAVNIASFENSYFVTSNSFHFILPISAPQLQCMTRTLLASTDESIGYLN